MMLYNLILVSAAGLVVFSGLLVIYTVYSYAEHVLYPRVTGLLGVAFIAVGIGVAVSVSSLPGGQVQTLGLIAVAGVSYALAGWLLTIGLIETEETITIGQQSIDTKGFSTDR